MHTRRMSDESFSEDNITDSNQRDRTLRALEGREDDYSRVTPPDSADATTDNENTAEIFMNIAREEPAHRHLDEREMREDQSAIVCDLILQAIPRASGHADKRLCPLSSSTFLPMRIEQ